MNVAADQRDQRGPHTFPAMVGAVKGDTRPPELVEGAWTLLQECGAGQAAHSGRTLLIHLLGTHGLLKAWGNSSSVCLAGLFHSIYGTNAFQRRSLGPNERARLSAAIGSDAEEMAWAFCNVERPRAIIRALQQGVPTAPLSLMVRTGEVQHPPILLSPSQICGLAEIECANLIEQKSNGTTLRDLYCASLSFPGILGADATGALRKHLSLQLTGSSHSMKEPAQ